MKLYCIDIQRITYMSYNIYQIYQREQTQTLLMFKQICLSDLNEQNKDTQFSRKRRVHRLELGIVAVANLRQYFLSSRWKR